MLMLLLMQDVGDYSYQDIDANIRVEEIVEFLSFGLGFTSRTNAWAGPDYWKYKKSKGNLGLFGATVVV